MAIQGEKYLNLSIERNKNLSYFSLVTYEESQNTYLSVADYGTLDLHQLNK